MGIDLAVPGVHRGGGKGKAIREAPFVARGLVPRNVKRWCSAVALLPVITGASVVAEETAPVGTPRLVRNGEAVRLSSDVAERVVQRMEEAFAGCGIVSEGEIWEGSLDGHPVASDGSYLLVRYPRPLTLGGYEEPRRAIELLIALPEGFSGRQLVLHGAEVRAFGKCDGPAVLRLICMEGLKEYLPRSYAVPCRSAE